MDSKRIIEISGVKVEVDLREATMVESYKVGQSVKVLKKYYDCWKVFPAVIVGFTEFKNLPTIEIIAVDESGSIVKINYNNENKDVEIAPVNKYDIIFDQSNVTAKLNRDIEQKEFEVQTLKLKRDAFVELFGKIIEGVN